MLYAKMIPNVLTDLLVLPPDTEMAIALFSFVTRVKRNMMTFISMVFQLVRHTAMKT